MPPLHATFFLETNQIKRIVLAPSPSFSLTIQTKTPFPNLESLIRSWIDSYLKKKEPSLVLPLSFIGLPKFTKEALLAISSIPYGQTKSYQMIAIDTGSPKAVRAIGNICHRNPFPLVIPCHRVIQSNGKIGGFAYDLALKKEMLQFEVVTSEE